MQSHHHQNHHRSPGLLSTHTGLFAGQLQGRLFEIVQVWHSRPVGSAVGVPVLSALGRQLVRVGGSLADSPVHGGHVPGGLQLAGDLQGRPALGLRLRPHVAAAAAGALTHGVNSHFRKWSFGWLAGQGLEAGLSSDRVV